MHSLALVSEIIHETPLRFKDLARFSFAHKGKDGQPFPVSVSMYDATISTLQTAVQKAKMDNSSKQIAMKKLLYHFHHLRLFNPLLIIVPFLLSPLEALSRS